MLIAVVEVLWTANGVRWVTVFGRAYRPEYAPDLFLGPWSNVTPFVFCEWNEYPEGVESYLDRTDPMPPGPQIYCVRVLPED